MSGNRLNWDSLGANWTFSYNANVIEKAFIGIPLVNSPQTEVTITGVIQPMILKCREDFQEIEEWFRTRSKFVTCPVFNKSGVGTYEGIDAFYDNSVKAIRWTGSPYSFSGGYYTGSNSFSGSVANPSLPVEWKLDICPLEDGLPFVCPVGRSSIQVGAIPFYVRPYKQLEIIGQEVFITLRPYGVGLDDGVYLSEVDGVLGVLGDGVFINTDNNNLGTT